MNKTLFCLIVFAVTALPAFAADYDLVINNGRVIDPETRLDAVRHVGIKDGSIAAVSDTPLSGRKVIDASGLDSGRLRLTVTGGCGSLGTSAPDGPPTVIAAIGETDDCEHLVDTRFELPLWDPVELAKEAQVLTGAEIRIDGEILGNEADRRLLLGLRLLRHAGELLHRPRSPRSRRRLLLPGPSRRSLHERPPSALPLPARSARCRRVGAVAPGPDRWSRRR